MDGNYPVILVLGSLMLSIRTIPAAYVIICIRIWTIPAAYVIICIGIQTIPAAYIIICIGGTNRGLILASASSNQREGY